MKTEHWDDDRLLAERYRDNGDERAFIRFVEDRSLLTLREVGGLSFDLIAELQGGTENSLRVRAFRNLSLRET